MERPDRPHEGSARDTNTRSSGNGYLLARLRDPDPEVRARFAEAVGIARASVGIPYLRDAVASDPDARVRAAARAALDVLLLPREGATSCASEGGVRAPVGAPSTALRDESEAILALFNEYIAHRLTPPHKPGQADLVCPVTAFLKVWENHPSEGLDKIERASLAAVRSIASFLGVPNSSASVKFLSFQGARRRVANYEALIAGRDEKEA